MSIIPWGWQWCSLEPIQSGQCSGGCTHTHPSPRAPLCASGAVPPRADIAYRLAARQGDSAFVQVRNVHHPLHESCPVLGCTAWGEEHEFLSNSHTLSSMCSSASNLKCNLKHYVCMCVCVSVFVCVSVRERRERGDRFLRAEFEHWIQLFLKPALPLDFSIAQNSSFVAESSLS